MPKDHVIASWAKPMFAIIEKFVPKIDDTLGMGDGEFIDRVVANNIAVALQEAGYTVQITGKGLERVAYFHATNDATKGVMMMPDGEEETQDIQIMWIDDAYL